MIQKITSMTPVNAYKTNSSVQSRFIPSFGHVTDTFVKKAADPISLEKAISKLSSDLKEGLVIQLTDDADPIRSLSKMSLAVEKLLDPNKISLRFNYGTSAGSECSFPIVPSGSAAEIKAKIIKPDFINELKNKIKQQSLKELVPEDYHDSLV